MTLCRICHKNALEAINEITICLGCLDLCVYTIHCFVSFECACACACCQFHKWKTKASYQRTKKKQPKEKLLLQKMRKSIYGNDRIYKDHSLFGCECMWTHGHACHCVWVCDNKRVRVCVWILLWMHAKWVFSHVVRSNARVTQRHKTYTHGRLSQINQFYTNDESSSSSYKWRYVSYIADSVRHR